MKFKTGSSADFIHKTLCNGHICGLHISAPRHLSEREEKKRLSRVGLINLW